MSIEKRPVDVASAAGFSVHLFTASGGAVAVLALYAAIERNFAACFAWLGLAFFIDGIDGTLARAARVQVTAASIDGTVLDLVIDFLTYVLVPVVALWRSDLMPTEASFWIGLIVTIASALYFADTRMKTDDLWFRGFPATWNIVVFYLFVLRPPWVVSAIHSAWGGGAHVHPDRVRASVAGRAVARAHHRHDLRMVRPGGDGDRRASCAAGLGRLGPDRDGGLFPGAAASAPFAAGARLSVIRRRNLASALRAGLNPWYSRDLAMLLGFIAGLVAEWLRRGLQILAPRFDSGRGLQIKAKVSHEKASRPVASTCRSSKIRDRLSCRRVS